MRRLLLIGSAVIVAVVAIGGCESGAKDAAKTEPPRRQEPFAREAVVNVDAALQAPRNDASSDCKCPPGDPLCTCL